MARGVKHCDPRKVRASRCEQHRECDSASTHSRSYIFRQRKPARIPLAHPGETGEGMKRSATINIGVESRFLQEPRRSDDARPPHSRRRLAHVQLRGATSDQAKQHDQVCPRNIGSRFPVTRESRKSVLVRRTEFTQSCCITTRPRRSGDIASLYASTRLSPRR